MKKVIKSRRASFQNMIARAMRKKSNSNIIGNSSFAEMQAKKDEALMVLFRELEVICGEEQARDIVNSVRLSQRGDTTLDCMPVMAVGETLAYVRNEARKAVKNVKACTSNGNIVDFEAERAKHRLDQMVTIYLMVMHAYYTLYGRFMTAMQKGVL